MAGARSAPVAFGAFLLLLCTVFPAVSIALYERPEVPRVSCAEGQHALILDVGGSSPYIRVVADDERAATWVPEVRMSDFHRASNFADIEIAEVLRSLRPGWLLVHGYDLQMSDPDDDQLWHRLWWVVLPEAVNWEGGGLYHVCGVQNKVTKEAEAWSGVWNVSVAVSARRLAAEKRDR